MTELSIIIVNYNVKYFLRQCLHSVIEATKDINTEIWVVDNDSVDGSVEMCQQQFPQVKLIANKENTGFSKANNQAIHQSKGKYVLILNPDTLVQADTLTKCIAFLDTHPETGALGVKLLDGNSNYLPESKRGFPTPWNSFCKMTRLSSLFSKSSFFNGYYLGHLDGNKNQEVEVLSGAFMMIPQTVLKEVVGFDERFFMYGEDIDLSYRIHEAGHKVSYLAETAIIHYKGESTKKGKLDYVKHFYNAMILYAEKHFGKAGFGFIYLLKLGIYLSAAVGFFKNILKLQLRFAIDLLLLTLSFFGLSKAWASINYGNANYYFDIPLVRYLAFFALIWLLMAYVFGHYDPRSSYRKYGLGIGFGALAVLIVYSLFPEEWRFSRVIILLGIPITMAYLWFSKKFWNLWNYRSAAYIPTQAKRVFIVGSKSSALHVNEVMNKGYEGNQVMGYVSPEPTLDDFFVADVSELKEAIRVHQVNELIFCSKEINTNLIFDWMTKLGPSITYKIASKDNESILGSDSKNRMGSWFTLDVGYKISDITLLRLKRILDYLVSIAVLLISPILLFKHGLRPFSWLLKVLFKGQSWVGYSDADSAKAKLPKIRNAIFDTSKLSRNWNGTADEAHRINLYYAKQYAIWQDVELIFKNLFRS